MPSELEGESFFEESSTSAGPVEARGRRIVHLFTEPMRDSSGDLLGDAFGAGRFEFGGVKVEGGGVEGRGSDCPKPITKGRILCSWIG